jgi:3',5'-nucleoside bisphosphate phosphatase
MSVDLHVHTTASDGLLTPTAVVDAALDLHLSFISITDHDSVAGVEEAIRAAQDGSLGVIAGVELSVHGPDDTDVHLLGYLFDHLSRPFLEALRELRGARLDRARRMVERLAAAGHEVDMARVLTLAGDGSVGRAHVARALVQAGSVESMEQAFAELIGREGPFYVPKVTLTATEAVAVIHRAGGVAVIAHPGIGGEGALLPLIEAGLDGIEAFHAEHTQPQRDHFASLAHRYGLVATGGSDFHGPGLRSASLGAGGCPLGAVEELRHRATISRP